MSVDTNSNFYCLVLCHHVLRDAIQKTRDEGGVAVHARGSVSTAPPSAGLRSPLLSKCFLVFCGHDATYT